MKNSSVGVFYLHRPSMYIYAPLTPVYKEKERNADERRNKEKLLETANEEEDAEKKGGSIQRISPSAPTEPNVPSPQLPCPSHTTSSMLVICIRPLFPSQPRSNESFLIKRPRRANNPVPSTRTARNDRDEIVVWD